MLDIAENDTGAYIPLKDIAARQEISKKYLEIIVKDLVKGKLLAASSGKGGGYKLCRRPEEYTVGEILTVSEGPSPFVACLGRDAASCPRAARCKTLPMWEEIDRIERAYFDAKKLSDLLG